MTRGFNVSGPKDVCGVGREAGESDAELPQSHTADCPEVSVLLERQEAGLAQEVHSKTVSLFQHMFLGLLYKERTANDTLLVYEAKPSGKLVDLRRLYGYIVYFLVINHLFD